MSISTLVLYGSCARQDNSPLSDVDLFAIGDRSDYRMVVASKVNLAVYSSEAALRMSRAGDLFMLHIVQEGRVIYDEQSLFRSIKDSFQFRASYSKDIEHATELGWALIRLAGTTKNWALLNKRIAWCTRTVLIALAANERKAIFSAKDLAAYADQQSVRQIIENKESGTRSTKTLSLFESFLQEYGSMRRESSSVYSLPELLSTFRSSGNAVGEKTIRALLGEVVRSAYT